MSSILLVDDEAMVADVLTMMLARHGHEVTAATDPHEGAELAAREFDLYLFDLRMPEISGADLTESVVARDSRARVLIMTAFPGDPLAARALRAGAVALVKKPFELGKILAHLPPAKVTEGGQE